MKMKLKFMAALLTAALFTGFAAERNRLELPHLKNVPVLDGVINASEWDDAAVFTGMQLTTRQGLAMEQSRFYMKWDKNFIYVAAVCADSNVKVVTAPPVLNWNDCLEFFITAPGKQHVAHWLFYATGGQHLDFIDAEYGSGYRSCTDGVKSAQKINQKDWTIEARIPAASLYRDYFDSRLPFHFNAHRSFSKRGFSRSDGRQAEFSSFAKVNGQFLKPVDFAELFLNDKPVAPVRMEKMDLTGMRLVCKDNVEVLVDFHDGRKVTLRSDNGVFACDFPAFCQGVKVRVLRDGYTIFSNRYDFHQVNPAIRERIAADQRAVTGLGVDVVDSMTRVFHQNPYSTQGSKLELTAARNEMENFQLVLFTGRDEVKGVNVTVSDFRTADGAVIPASAVRLYHEGTMIADPSGYPTVNGPGEYPDPLYELKPLDFKPMQVEAVWAAIKIPAAAKAGIYNGKVTVTAQNQISREVAVTLTVWDFEIPQRQSLRTAFSIWEREIYRLYFEKQKRPAEDFLKTIEDYAMMAVEHRLTPLVFKTPHLLPPEIHRAVVTTYEKQEDGSYKVIPGKSDEITKKCLDNGAVSFCAGPEIPHAEYKNIKEQDWKAMWKAIRDHYAANGMLKYAYAYPFDEPGNRNRGIINDATSWLKEAAPELPLLLTGACALLPSKEFKNVDIWCPQEHWVNYRNKQEAQSIGQQVWWYPCSGPWFPYPNYHLDIESGAWRSLAWATYKYNFDGILYWAMAFYNVKDPRRNNSYSSNGEGVLLYGNPENGAPCPSIRLKVIADSLEDYEYLKLLEAAVARNKDNAAKAEDVAKARELLQLKDIFRYMDDYALTSGEYNAFRKAAAELILKLK